MSIEYFGPNLRTKDHQLKRCRLHNLKIFLQIFLNKRFIQIRNFPYIDVRPSKSPHGWSKSRVPSYNNFRHPFILDTWVNFDEHSRCLLGDIFIPSPETKRRPKMNINASYHSRTRESSDVSFENLHCHRPCPHYTWRTHETTTPVSYHGFPFSKNGTHKMFDPCKWSSGVTVPEIVPFVSTGGLRWRKPYGPGTRQIPGLGGGNNVEDDSRTNPLSVWGWTDTNESPVTHPE